MLQVRSSNEYVKEWVKRSVIEMLPSASKKYSLTFYRNQNRRKLAFVCSVKKQWCKYESYFANVSDPKLNSAIDDVIVPCTCTVLARSLWAGRLSWCPRCRGSLSGACTSTWSSCWPGVSDWASSLLPDTQQRLISCWDILKNGIG